MSLLLFFPTECGEDFLKLRSLLLWSSGSHMECVPSYILVASGDNCGWISSSMWPIWSQGLF